MKEQRITPTAGKRDLVLAAVLLMAGLVLYGLFGRGRAGGCRVLVIKDGQPYGTYSLFEEQTIVITDEAGSNTLVIRDGKVCMEAADCPDKYCVTQGQISREGQSIICLPHRLSAEILSDAKEKEVDVIAR